MERQIQCDVREIDTRSSQFSCEFTITNDSSEPLEITSMALRLPQGITLKEAVDPYQIELTSRYDDMCKRLENLVSTELTVHSQAELEDYALRVRETMRALLRPSSIIDAYASILLRRAPKFAAEARQRLVRFPIKSLAEATRAVALLKKHGKNELILDTADQYIATLGEIERQDDFLDSRRSKLTVQPGKSTSALYIVKARRGWADVWSYSINFDLTYKLRDGSQGLMSESASIAVSPSALSLTMVAVLAALLAAVLRLISIGGDSALDLGATWQSLTVAGITALILFNIFDFTGLKDKVSAKVSWRLAIFVGFLCGYLNDRVLAALDALLG